MLRFKDIPLGSHVSFTAYRRPSNSKSGTISGEVVSHFISHPYMDDIEALSAYYRNALPTIPAFVRKFLPSKVEEGVNFVSVLNNDAIITLPLSAIVPTTLKVSQPVLVLVLLTDTPEEDLEIVSRLYNIAGSQYVEDSLNLILTIMGDASYIKREVETRLAQRGFDTNKVIGFTVT